jgi:hypothetical protein
MKLHERFEWDPEKAESNARKHGVTFDQAAEALLDAEGDRYHSRNTMKSMAWRRTASSRRPPTRAFEISSWSSPGRRGILKTGR